MSLDMRHLPCMGTRSWRSRTALPGVSKQQLGHGYSGSTAAECNMEVGFLPSGGFASDAISPKYHVTQAV